MDSKVKKGYKMTEVGLIPEDWEVGNLENYWAVIDCKHITAKFVKNGIPLASIREVQSIYVDLTNAMQTTDFFYRKLIEGGRKPMNGDLIFSRNATVGEVAQVINSHPMFAMGQDVCLLRKRSPIYSTSFLQTIIQSFIVHKQLENLMVGSTFKRVNIEQIRNFLIPFPCSAEQKAIAQVLSDTDALIQSLEKQIGKKRLIKQGAMQELLRPRAGWEVRKLGEVASINMGQSPSSSNYNNLGYGLPLIQGNADVKNRVTIIRNHTTHITKKCNAGDVIMSVRAPVGEISQATFDACIGRGVCAISYSNKYIYHYLIFIEPTWAKLSTGSTFDSVNSTTVRELEIPIPALEQEQTRIATILSDMDAEIESLEKKLSKYKELKQGLMQQLLTGKIRLV